MDMDYMVTMVWRSFILEEGNGIFELLKDGGNTL